MRRWASGRDQKTKLSSSPAVMWRAFFLLASLQTSMGRVHKYRYNSLPGVLTGRPWFTAEQDTHKMCASRCSKHHYVHCTGYSFTPNGTCRLHPTWCWNLESQEDHPDVVSYERPTVHVWSCQNGGLALNNTCYFHRHSRTPLTWEAAKIACGELGACARLAQPKDRLTYEFLMNPWRPNDEEWIGAYDDDGSGNVINLDGSQPSWQPPLVSHAESGPIFLPQGLTKEIHRTTNVHSAVHRYVCEAPHDCRLRDSCPEGWLLIHRRCFQLFTEKKTWDDANAYCGSQGPHGRLADIDSLHWAVLWESFFQSDTGAAVWLGVRDQEIEGYWVNIYNRTVGTLDWKAGRPSNKGNCLATEGYFVKDVVCGYTKQFVCTCNANSC